MQSHLVFFLSFPSDPATNSGTTNPEFSLLLSLVKKFELAWELVVGSDEQDISKAGDTTLGISYQLVL